MADNLRLLAAISLLAGLADDELNRLAAQSLVRTIVSGAVAAIQGAPAEYLIVVESGMLIAVHDTKGGRRLHLGDFAAPCAVDKAAVRAAGCPGNWAVHSAGSWIMADSR